MKSKDASAEPPGPAAACSPPVLRMKSTDLFQGRREVIIEHDGSDYRLRMTASGKLILTK